MSFFTELTSDTIVLFSSHQDNEPYKKYLSQLGGTFVRELETKKGNKLPAWVFDQSKREEVEAFVVDTEDTESVISLPDITHMFDDILRRLEDLEKGLYEVQESLGAIEKKLQDKRGSSRPH